MRSALAGDQSHLLDRRDHRAASARNDNVTFHRELIDDRRNRVARNLAILRQHAAGWEPVSLRQGARQDRRAQAIVDLPRQRPLPCAANFRSTVPASRLGITGSMIFLEMDLLFMPVKAMVGGSSRTGRISMQTHLSRRSALLLFAVIVMAWGLNWTITKTLVQSVTPLWMTAIRSAVATAALAALLFARGEMIVPRRGDLPVVLVTSIFHMVAFSALVGIRPAIRRRRPFDRPWLHHAALGDAGRLVVPGRADDIVALTGNGAWPGRPRRHVQSVRLQLGRCRHAGR